MSFPGEGTAGAKAWGGKKGLGVFENQNAVLIQKSL